MTRSSHQSREGVSYFLYFIFLNIFTDTDTPPGQSSRSHLALCFDCSRSGSPQPGHKQSKYLEIIFIKSLHIISSNFNFSIVHSLIYLKCFVMRNLILKSQENRNAIKAFILKGCQIQPCQLLGELIEYPVLHSSRNYFV